MLGRGTKAHTSHDQLHTHASLFEHSEQVQVLKYQPIPSFAFVSLSKLDLLSLSLWL